MPDEAMPRSLHTSEQQHGAGSTVAALPANGDATADGVRGAEARVPGIAVHGAAPEEPAPPGREHRAPSLRPRGPAERQLLPPRRESAPGLASPVAQPAPQRDGGMAELISRLEGELTALSTAAIHALTSVQQALDATDTAGPRDERTERWLTVAAEALDLAIAAHRAMQRGAGVQEER